MKIGVITAMSTEHRQISALLENKKQSREGRLNFVEGTMGDHSVVLMECGIGKVNAAIGAVELIRHYTPDCIINTGVAGGIDTSLGMMDVVVGKQVAYHDVWCGDGNAHGQVQGLPLFFDSNEELYNQALKLQGETPIHGGLICSGDQFISDHKELEVIKKNFPEGLAVDMESGAIAQTCYLYQVPFISFRIISDTPGGDDRFGQYLNFWETMADRSFRVTKSFLSSLPTHL